MSLPRWEVTDSRASAVLADAIRQLQSTSDSARRDAEVLMHAACEIDQTSVIRDPDQLIHHNALAAFHHYLDRRKARRTYRLHIGTSGVLVYRPQTQ
ncbi:hypothetical protein ACMAZH_01920 [Arenicellales bacterium nBUS_45]